MINMKFGYMRVSTLDQNLDRQKKQLEEFDAIVFSKNNRYKTKPSRVK